MSAGTALLTTPESFWRAALTGYIPPLCPPAGIRAGERTGELAYAADTMQVPARTTAGLQTVALQAAVDLSTILFGAWGILLSRFAGQEDVLFGMAEEAAGLLPLRLKIDPAAPVESWLSTVATQVRNTARHRVEEPQQIQQWSGLPPEMPLYETAIVWHPLSNDERPALLIHARLSGPCLELRAEYERGRFGKDSVAGVLESLSTLLEAIALAPYRPISELSLINERQLRKQLIDWNLTESLPIESNLFHRRFEKQVLNSPRSAALTFYGETLSYDELDRKVNQLARYLQKAGAGPERIVAVCIERSLDLVIALLATWKAGAAYLPLDPAYPRERLQFMLEDSGADLLLTQEPLRSRFSQPPRVVAIDAERRRIAREPETPLETSVQGENLAYVIYTSGSTGKPKGVMIEHRQLANFFYSMDVILGDEPSTWIALTSVSFDISVLELFWTLTTGAHVILQADSERFSQGEYSIAAQIARHRVTHLQCTPSLGHILASAPDCRGALSGLRHILIGGEPLPDALVKELASASDMEIHNMYGPTETTIWSAAHHLSRNEWGITVGRPIANTYTYILDEHQNPLPIGAAGELFIGGAGVARGYLRRAELTNDRFVANPFRPEPDARMYKSGDLARYRPDGNIEILGRIDTQIKVLGFRVEVEEIEAVLQRHPNVRTAAVIGREDAPGNARLVAFIVAQTATPELSAELRSFLQRHLPSYLVPTSFVFLESLPQTPNGKVDRKALALQPDVPDSPPVSGTIEHALVTWLADALGIPAVSPDDDYFDRGGTSILAVGLFAKIKQTYGVDLGLATIFEARTMARLASIIRLGNPSGTQSCIVRIRPGGAGTPLFLVHGAGGSVLVFNGLTKYIDAKRPVYGIQAQAFDKRGPALIRAEDIAAHYVREMRRTQPRGPYCLLGYSLGATVAFEMAQQLVAAGERVAFLGNIDGLLKRNLPFSKKVARFLYQARLDWAAMRQNGVLSHLAIRLRAKTLRIVYLLYSAAARPAPRSLESVADINWFAVATYRPRVYPGRLILFRTNDEDAWWDPAMGWGGLAAGGIEIHDLPGNHYDIFDGPGAEQLARIIERKLDPQEAS